MHRKVLHKICINPAFLCCSMEILPTKLYIFLLNCQITTIIGITVLETIQITLLYANRSIDMMP